MSTLELSDGRTLSYTALGAAEGPLVVVLDGPCSRGLARAAAATALDLGIRLVAPDRPGAGESTPLPGRTIADWPADHAALLDALGAVSSGILGQSGGTPYALAAAAALPERTTGVSLTGAIAPFDDPHALAEAGRQVRGGVKLARRAPWLLRLALRLTARRDPRKIALKVAEDLPPADAEVMAAPANWAIHERTTAEILARPEAVAEELALLGRPWGIDLGAIRGPVELWSGDRDETHPTALSRRLARQLGGAPVHVVEDAGTFGLMPRYADALRHAAGAPARA